MTIKEKKHGVIEMQPEIDYVKIGQHIKAARLEKGYSQADLGALVGCSNNHMSHVEVGQTKVSLAMLLKLAFVLEKDFDFFLLDTPYAKCDSIINAECKFRRVSHTCTDIQPRCHGVSATPSRSGATVVRGA